MLFIGPNDLAASMGYFAFDHAKIEEVQVATTRVLAAAKASGKFAGHFALSAEIGLLFLSFSPILIFFGLRSDSADERIAAQRSRQGFEFMNCGADIVAVTAWMSSQLAKMKALLEKKDGESENPDTKGGYVQ
jgi:4-hydroxy-2-oxoheptanedioate aldolase